MMITCSIERWTPEKATEALSRNSHNRRINKKHVARIASDMLAGRYKMNGQPIIVSDRGILLDGQHRLNAMIDAGLASQPFVTVRGVEDDAFTTIDTGVSRDAQVVLNMSGVENSTAIASVSRMLIAYTRENGIDRVAMNKVTSAEVIEYAANPRLAECVEWARGVAKTSGVPTSILAAAALIIEEAGGSCRQWLSNAANGFGLTVNTTSYALFRFMRDIPRNTQQERIAAVAGIVKAWNADIAGKNILLLRSSTRERWPVVRTPHPAIAHA